ncbi:hypothetical protein CsSME_00052037 [Camellia sinensis var. sinensis]|uniref:protein BIG GRAIN 1-like A n=1 Tax=Camellia sinensis TaxID=4442 RepID=UPI001036677B|nr:protein BIG GRAIN 1-like A [Camellia sinensis]
MDTSWDRSLRDDQFQYQYQYRRQRDNNNNNNNNPSFSSTLLDAIYRSIDEGSGGGGGGGGGRGRGGDEFVLYRETMRKKSSNCHGGGFEDDVDTANLRRACIIEKWMEKKVSEKIVLRRKSVADFETKSRTRPNRDESVFLKSSSSSSDSSSGGGFSSSEAESVHGVPCRSSSTFTSHRPKPIRTSISAPPEKFNKQGSSSSGEFKVFDNSKNQKPKHENSFVKTKSKAMKIYGDLKKAKQPISPGGKLSNFLNSLFTAGSPKKAKISSSSNTGSYNDTSSDCKSKSSTYASACSSASSFSRSCLSKTPSSRGKLSNGVKRSVTFYPVSVIVDEDCQPCGEKSLNKDDPNSAQRNSINEELKLRIMEKNRRVEEVARDLLKNYQNKVQYDEDQFDNDDDDEDDDAASYASSDLFELDNLSAIGIDRYREELPVYETTRLDTNQAIANGLI